MSIEVPRLFIDIGTTNLKPIMNNQEASWTPTIYQTIVVNDIPISLLDTKSLQRLSEQFPHADTELAGVTGAKNALWVNYTKPDGTETNIFITDKTELPLFPMSLDMADRFKALTGLDWEEKGKNNSALNKIVMLLDEDIRQQILGESIDFANLHFGSMSAGLAHILKPHPDKMYSIPPEDISAFGINGMSQELIQEILKNVIGLSPNQYRIHSENLENGVLLMHDFATELRIANIVLSDQLKDGAIFVLIDSVLKIVGSKNVLDGRELNGIAYKIQRIGATVNAIFSDIFLGHINTPMSMYKKYDQILRTTQAPVRYFFDPNGGKNGSGQLYQKRNKHWVPISHKQLRHQSPETVKDAMSAIARGMTCGLRDIIETSLRPENSFKDIIFAGGYIGTTKDGTQQFGNRLQFTRTLPDKVRTQRLLLPSAATALYLIYKKDVLHENGTFHRSLPTTIPTLATNEDNYYTRWKRIKNKLLNPQETK